jgi:NAD(P)-dependent dehydrogenase (short-subunit alcohol dehydrogenase family)
MTKALVGKNVIITGASRGLGRHLAGAMWHHGASLLLVARAEEALLNLRAALMASAEDGQQVHVVRADLRTANAVPTIVGTARRVWGKLDVLINNAAVLGPIGKVWENDWDEWQATMRINLLAVVELCQACLPWMFERRQGRIINLSGGGATRPRPNFSAYATAKAGLVRFSEILAHEVRDMNVQVNCVAPGAMHTDMLQAVLCAGPEAAGEGEYAQAVKQAESEGVSPQRAVELCVFLASEAGDGITGKLLSAVWDPWETLTEHVGDLHDSDIYTLRRIVPGERGKDWG